MSTTETGRWQRTSPLAAIFYLGRIYKAIAQNAFQYLAPLFAFLFAYEGKLITKVIFSVTAFFLITLGAAFVRYWFFRYQITDHSVLIRDGVIKKTQLDIKFDRIQAISTRQNIVFRAFGLFTVKLDTAGSAGQEGHLPAVTASLSADLKERIRRESPATTSTTENDDDEPRDTNIRALMQLGPSDLIRVGLTSKRVLILLAFLAPVLQQFEATIGDDVDKNTILAATQGSVAAGVGLVAMIVIGFLLFLVLASIVGAFLRYHRFTLVADSGALRSTAGLLTHHEHSVNLAKIQSFVATQNIMLLLFKRFRVQANQASSGKSAHSEGKNFIVPLCETSQLSMLSHEVFREEFPDLVAEPRAAVFQPIAKQYMRSRFILSGILPASAFTALFLTLLGPVALILPLLWLPISACAVWRYYKRYGMLVTRDGIALRRGFIGYRVTAFLQRKVQRISVTQTFLQRRKGLATLRFYLASGSLKIPYIDAALALELRDRILYRIESSQLAWH